MAKKKISRKELLKKPDEFMTLSSRAVKFFTSHQRQFKLAGVAVAIIVIVFLAAQTYFRYVNKKGQGAYNAAYYALVENMKPDADPAALKKSEELFKGLMDDYGLSRAARLALPQVGYVKFTQKNYAEAISMYRAFLDKVSGNSEYESLARLALAACYEARGDLEKAIDTLKPILAHADGPFNEVAMLNLERIYRTSNQHDKAKGVLKEFVELY